jgi:SpoU rRNA methylase family enzyme
LMVGIALVSRKAVKGVVYVDFGRNKIYALTDDGDEVMVFNNLAELAERLRPAVIVLDNLPGKQQNATADLAKTDIIFLRLKNLKKLSEERKNNGVKKSDENDVVALRTLFRRNPDDFQPLFETPERAYCKGSD